MVQELVLFHADDGVKADYIYAMTTRLLRTGSTMKSRGVSPGAARLRILSMAGFLNLVNAHCNGAMAMTDGIVSAAVDFLCPGKALGTLSRQCYPGYMERLGDDLTFHGWCGTTEYILTYAIVSTNALEIRSTVIQRLQSSY